MQERPINHLFCKKHLKEIQLGDCTKCFKDGKAEYTDLYQCMSCNITIQEEKI